MGECKSLVYTNDQCIGCNKEANAIFESMHKYSESSRMINCTCCGYDTCRQMVRAIYNGFNSRENCIHYQKDLVNQQVEHADIRRITAAVKKKLDHLTEDWSSDDMHNRLHGRRILIAEDMMINAEMLKQMLSSSGVHSDIEEDGRALIDRFAESPVGYYDAILMDVNMPVLSGLDAAKEIRRMRRKDAKTIPIVALTANDTSEDVSKSMEAGMNEHLSKPVEPVELYKTLEKVL